MTKAIKRCTSFLLILMLVVTMLPSAYAAETAEETDPSTSTETTEETDSTAFMETPEETIVTEPEENTLLPPDESEPPVIEECDTTPPEPDIIDDSEPPLMLLIDGDIALASFSNCQATTWATVWVNTDEYSPIAGTTNRFIYYNFAGKARNRNNAGLKAIKVNGTWQAAYCIEPGIAEGSTYTEEDMTMDEFIGSSVVPSTLTEQQLKAMCVAVMYGQRTLPQSANYELLSNMVATQIIVWEIAIGWRNATPPYAQTNDAFIRRFENAYGKGPEATSMYISIGGRLKNVITAYNQISAKMAAHSDAIPSFTSAYQNSAPTIDLKPNGNGQYTATLTDSNRVLFGYSFPKVSGLTFSTSGNSLTITSDRPLNSTLVAPTRNRVNLQGHPFFVWYNGSYQVMLGSQADPAYVDLPVYFRVRAINPTGSMKLVKTTEDGKNLSGWKFGVYSDSACTNLISGPHTTNSTGTLSVSNLTAGTVYVKELGHTDAAIAAQYTCSSTNPQKVTITGGTTATVRFHNRLNTGSVKLVKETNTGKNLDGWKIGLYTDSGCTSQVSGSPFTTGSDGTVTVTGLKPGTYYAREVGSADSYWVCDTAVKPVTVVANQTAFVTFTNIHYGRIKFHKTTNTGNHLGGWTFQVRNADGDVIGEFTTDETGYACTENLLPGRYTVQEVPTDDPYWTVELGSHNVTVEAGKNTVDQWNNKEQGLGWFYKKTNTGENVEGWHITVYSDEGCTQKVYSLTTNSEGKVGHYLAPGTYWAKETGDEHGRFENEYWMVDETVQKFEIKPHANTEITFTNVQYGKLRIVKKMDTDGSVEGWQFKITDASGKMVDGSPFTTDKDGIILTENLLPGKYTVEEILPDDSLNYCKSQNPQTVTVTQGQTQEVTFTNALRPGKVTVNKVDITGSPLAGATFLLEWSEEGALWYPVTFSDSKDVVKGGCSNPDLVDGCLTTGAEGVLEWGNLYPGLQYRLTETKAPDGYNLLKESAFEGELPVDDLTVEVRVTNVRTFTLPKTGASSGLVLRIASLLAAIGCLGFLLYRRKVR